MASEGAYWGIVLASGPEQALTTGPDLAFLGLGSRPLLAHVLLAFEACREIERVVVAVAPERCAPATILASRFTCRKVARVVPSGTTRRAGWMAAMAAVEEEAGGVVVHEICRPCVRPETLSACVEAARKYGAALTASPIRDPVKRAGSRPEVAASVKADMLWLAQHPRAYSREALAKILRTKAVWPDGDELRLLERAKVRIRLVGVDYANPRIRTPDDLAMVSSLLT